MQASGAMQTHQSEAVPEATPCRECEGLRIGTRSMQRPHEYLMVKTRSEGGTTYRCLLCRSDIRCAPVNEDHRWWRWH